MIHLYARILGFTRRYTASVSKLTALLTAFATLSPAQTSNINDWMKLIGNKKCEEAKTLCSQFVDAKDTSQQTEAQKCLANVSLCGHDIVFLQGDDAGGGSMGGSFTPESIDEAIVHLNLGIKLSPQDLSIHQGRLHLLEISGQYDAMIKALDESCSIYKGKGAPDAWLDYSGELSDLRQYKVGLEFMKVLEKHYPDNPDIIGNVGAFLSFLKRDEEAIPYLEKSVAMAPKDPINAWNLGREYDYAGKTELANTWYLKALALEDNPERKKQSMCLYAEFVEKKLKDRQNACNLQMKNCDPEQQTACTSSEAPAINKK